MPKIIMVEDDPLISEIYQKKFTESGFEVAIATSGEEALKALKNGPADLMLLDLVMPRMSGFDIIKKIREDETNASLKIIIFSNTSQKEDRDKAMQLGANGFIAKSEFKPSDLVNEIKRYLNQYAQQQKNEARLNGQTASESASGQKKILLIEDEEIFIDMFSEKLRQEGFNVICAKNGAWGVKEALTGGFDLLIMDMVMPAMTGEEMIAKVKLEEKTKKIPIIMLSASVDDETRKRVEKMDIQGFYIKTQITPSELADKAGEILNK